MDDHILAIYCICDDLLINLNHCEDSQRKMSDAEIMTTAIIAMLYFGGNFSSAAKMLNTPKYIPGMLSKSQFNRRLHKISHLFVLCFQILSQTWKELNSDSIYSIDSFPVAVCDNYRIKRCKIYQQEQYRGYTASKRRYFYGVKVHLMVTEKGQPIEIFLTPGSISDTQALKAYDFDLKPNSIVYADKAYNDYKFEDLLKELGQINLMPIRKINSKRQWPDYVQAMQHYHRKAVETAASLITKKMPKSIHAVTKKGFELKVYLFVLAFSCSCLVTT